MFASIFVGVDVGGKIAQVSGAARMHGKSKHTVLQGKHTVQEVEAALLHLNNAKQDDQSQALAIRSSTELEHHLQAPNEITFPKETVPSIQPTADKVPTDKGRPGETLRPRVVFPSTAEKEEEKDEDTSKENKSAAVTHEVSPLKSKVFYKIAEVSSMSTGVVVSPPEHPTRPFYTVFNPTSQAIDQVRPVDSHIWLNDIDLDEFVKQPSKAPVDHGSGGTTNCSLEKEMRAKRTKFEIDNLPTNRDACMAFHDNAWVKLSPKHWKSASGKHLLEYTKTTVEIEELSSDLYFAVVNGKSSSGKNAADMFPILKDPSLVNNGGLAKP